MEQNVTHGQRTGAGGGGLGGGGGGLMGEDGPDEQIMKGVKPFGPYIEVTGRLLWTQGTSSGNGDQVQ